MAKRLNLLLISSFILLGFFFFFSVHTSGDTFFFMSTGRQVWQEKQIPKTADFIYGPEDKTLYTVEWLSGLTYYILVSNFGLSGLIVLRVILALLTIYFVYLACKIFTKNSTLLLTIVIFAGYTLSARTNDRPESFSYLFVAILNYICLSYLFENKLNKLAFALPFIFLAWPNFHPFSIVGVGLLTFYTFLALVEKIAQKNRLPNLNRFLTITTSSIILALLEYKRLFAFLKAGNFASANLVEFGSIKDRILLTHGYDLLNQIPNEIYFYLIFSFIFLTLTILYFKKGNATKTQILLGAFCLFFLALPIKYFRTIPLVIIVVLPQLVFLSLKVLPRASYLKYVTSLILAMLIILTAGSITNRDVIGSRENTFVITAASGNGQQTPVGVVNRWWIKKFPQSAQQIIISNLNTKHLFTDTPWNNYFVWYLPQIKVFADAQTYDRSAKDYQEEKALLEGGNNWEQLLETFDIDTVVKSQPFTLAFIYTPVENLKDWKLIYLDDVYMIYARNDVIKSLPVDLSKIKPDLPAPLKFEKGDEAEAISQLQNLLMFDAKNGFARDQLIIYYMENNVQKALNIAEESRQIDPNNPVFSLHLAEIYAKLNDCTKAKSFADEAKIKSFHHPIIESYAEDATKNCQ